MNHPERWLAILPGIALLLLFSVYPVGYILIATFFNYTPSTISITYFSLDNFKRLATDQFFGGSLINTIIFFSASVSSETVLGILLALTVHRLKIPFSFWTLLLIPSVLSPIVVAAVWRMILDTNFGILNYLISFIGVSPIPWLDSPFWGMASLIIVDIWQWMPFCTVITAAALQSISVQIYELALIDGASPWRTFRSITLPLLSPITLVILTLRSIDSVRLFDVVYGLTAGGPGNSTETMSFYIYKVALRFLDIGYAATMSLVLLVMIFGICFGLVFIFTRFQSRGWLKGELRGE